MLNRWILLAAVLPCACACACACSSDADVGGEGNRAAGGATSGGAGRDGGDGATGPGGSTNGGSGGTGARGGSGAGGSESDPGDCDLVDYQLLFVPRNLMFLLDSSGSMGFFVSESSSESRWDVLRPALVRATDTLPDDAGVGLIYFPGTPEDTCFEESVAVPVARLESRGSNSGQRAAVEQSLAGTEPGGGTPTHDAFHFTRTEVLRARQERAAPGDWWIVLATDGEPTEGRFCGMSPTSAALVDDVNETHGVDGIGTFVIGLPGSESFRANLSAMAKAGGTGGEGCAVDGGDPCHFDLAPSQDLGTALDAVLRDIGDATASCDIMMPELPDGETLDEDYVMVRRTDLFGGRDEIPRDPTATDECPEGDDAFWIYADEARRIRLCGAACDQVRSWPSDEAMLSFGCKPTLRSP